MATQPAPVPVSEPDLRAESPRLSMVAVSLLIVIFETGCAIIVFANRIALLISGASLGLAAHHSWMHSQPVRLPLLAIATAGSVLNLFVLWNARRLRRRPQARWRLRPLRSRDKLRNALVFSASVVTLFMVISELVLHHSVYSAGH